MNNKYIKLFVVMVMSFFVSMTITSAARYEDINSLLAGIEELETEDNPIDYVYIIGNHVFTGSFQYSLKDLNDASRTIPDGVSSYMYYVERIINSDFEPIGWDIEGARDAYGSELKLEGPFTITHVDLVLDEDYSSAKEVAQAKADAIEALDEYRSLLEDLKGTYNTNGNELDNIVENLKTSIADLNDLEAINHQLELAKESMNAIESDKEIADKANAELSQAKAEAIESLVSQAGDMKETHSSQYEEVLTTVTDAIADIQAATEKDEIESILNDAIEALENMDSDALVNAKNDAKAELNSYPEKYLNHKLSETETNEIIEKYTEKIDDATDADELEGILAEADAELEKIPDDETVVENKVNALITTLEEFKDTFANGLDELKPEDLDNVYTEALSALDDISAENYENVEALTEALTEAEETIKNSILESVKSKVQEALKTISTTVDEDSKVVPTSAYIDATTKLAKATTYEEIETIYNNLKNTPKVDVSENSLEVARSEAQKKFDEYVGDNTYTREENADAYNAVKDKFDQGLTNAKSEDEIADLIFEVIPELEKIKSDADYIAEELQAAKDGVEATLTAKIGEYSEDDYTTTNWSEFESIKEAAIAEAADATTVDEVNAIVEKAEADMDAIPTIEEQKETYTTAVESAYEAVKDNYTLYADELIARKDAIVKAIAKATKNNIDKYSNYAETQFTENGLEKKNIYSDDKIATTKQNTIDALDDAIAAIDGIDGKIRNAEDRTYLAETKELIKTALTSKINDATLKDVKVIAKYKNMDDETTKEIVVEAFRSYIVDTLILELDETKLLTTDAKESALTTINSATEISVIISTFDSIQLQSFNDYIDTFKNNLDGELTKEIKLHLIVSKETENYKSIEGVQDIVDSIDNLKNEEYTTVADVDSKLEEITNKVLELVKPYVSDILDKMKDSGFDSEYGYLSQANYTTAIQSIEKAKTVSEVIKAYEDAINTIKKINVSSNVEQDILDTYLDENSEITELVITDNLSKNLNIKNPQITITGSENVKVTGDVNISAGVDLTLDNITLDGKVKIEGTDVKITGTKTDDNKLTSVIEGSIEVKGNKVTIDQIKVTAADEDTLETVSTKKAVVEALDAGVEFNLSNSEIEYTGAESIYSLLHLNGNANVTYNKFNIDNVKNPIEFKWNGSELTEVNISNNTFTGDNHVSNDSHNIISVYKVANDAEINIMSNHFETANSVLRISNPDNHKVTYYVVGNIVDHYSYKTGDAQTSLIVIRVNSNIELSNITIEHEGNKIGSKDYGYVKDSMDTNSETRLVYVKKDSGKTATGDLNVKPYTK